MVKLQWSVVSCFMLITFPVFGSATIASSIRKSSTTNVETEIAIALDKAKNEIDYCKKNRGRSFGEVDVSNIGPKGEYEIITDGLIAAKYERYGDFSKAADYYYKDYLTESNPQKYWKSKHNWSNEGGDSTPFPLFMDTLKQNQDYLRMLKVYPEYYAYSYLGRVKGPGGVNVSKEDEEKFIKNEMQYDSELKENYENFMQEWQEAKKLAKTTKPIPLDPAVQNHEWFYSDKQKEVLKALEYYNANKVNFMLEKALKHKDPVISAKAKEYLESLTKGAGDETKH